jgi:hypothetical protein
LIWLILMPFFLSIGKVFDDLELGNYGGANKVCSFL